MSTCGEFTQNAWRPELCANCQRPRLEHATCPSSPKSGVRSSPVPAKRTSVILKSASVPPPFHLNGGGGELNFDSTDIRKGESGDKGTSSVITVIGNSVEENQKTLSNADSDATVPKSTPSAPGALPKGALVDKENRRARRNSKVVFASAHPEIIGYDGGDGSVGTDEENDENSEDCGEEVVFTEEEKRFALLALENTLWNSDIQNLKLDRGPAPSSATGLRRVPSKELEDLDLDLHSKLGKDRFSSLRDCDAIARKFGTFPQQRKVSSSGTKMSAQEVFSEASGSSAIELHRISDGPEGRGGWRGRGRRRGRGRDRRG